MAQCTATRKDGQPCTVSALGGKPHCFAHDSESADIRRAAKMQGGRNSARAERIGKHLPEDLRDVRVMLVELIDDVRSDRRPARVAMGVAALVGKLIDLQRLADERAVKDDLAARLEVLEARAASGSGRAWRR